MEKNYSEFAGRCVCDGYVYTKLLCEVSEGEWEYVVLIYDEDMGEDIDCFAGDEAIACLLEKQMECYPSSSIERHDLIAVLT